MIKKNKVLILFSFILLVLVVSFSFIFFEFNENKTVETITKSNLYELSDLYAHTFDSKLQDQLYMLESQARFFKDIDMSNYAEVKKTIMSTKGCGEFKRISVSDLTGMTINYDGRSSGNIYNTDYFQRTIQTGKSQISNSIYLDEDRDEVLGLAVPIIQNDKIVGVITGTISETVWTNLFQVAILNSESCSFVISPENKIIVSSKSHMPIEYYNEFFSDITTLNSFTSEMYNTIETQFDKTKTEVLVFEINGNAYTCLHSKITTNDWVYLSIVPFDYVKMQQKKLSSSFFVILLITVIAFIVFSYVLQILIKSNDAVESDNERLKIANSQVQALVFELNPQKQQVVFSGDTEFILGTKEHIFPIEYFYTDFFSHIHEDDISVTHSLKDFSNQDSFNFSSEIRFKCSDDIYYWFKISCTLIENQNASNQKLIGNFTNVNEQIIHEQELKTIAETDLLSGLLNKSYTEKKIQRYLDTAETGAVCALFVIDLDNFKKTNDTLGHSMGDIAIRDSAKKIALIFSERDIIGRFGGDEFCVFMCFKNNVSQAIAEKIITEKAENLCNILKEEYFDDKNSVMISSSIGIALYPHHGKNFHELFKKADSALYFVKQNGKNNFKFYSPEMPDIGESVYE